MSIAILAISERSSAANWIRSAIRAARSAFRQRPVTAAVRTGGAMARDEQFARLSGIVARGVTRADDASGFHKSAALQLDLAQYALSSVMDELSVVMAVPGRGSPALVRIFEPRMARDFAAVRAA